MLLPVPQQNQNLKIIRNKKKTKTKKNQIQIQRLRTKKTKIQNKNVTYSLTRLSYDSETSRTGQYQTQTPKKIDQTQTNHLKTLKNVIIITVFIYGLNLPNFTLYFLYLFRR